MGLSTGGIVAIIVITLFILILLLLIIIFIIVYCGKKDLNGECKKSRDCKSGYICYRGECKVPLGENCDDDADCAHKLICVKGVCKRRKRKQMNVNNDGEIEIDTIDSSVSIKHVQPGRKPGDAGIVVGVNGEDNRKNYVEEKWVPKNKIYQKDQPKKELYIVDICNYSSYAIYLMSDNSFVVSESGNNRNVKSELDISSINNFNGYLHAIGNNRLYYLDNNTLDTDQWGWIRVSWAPHDIVDMSIPHDKSFIWLRNKSHGYLYDHSGHLIEKVDNPYRRVYGVDRHNYVTFDNNGDAIVQPGHEPILDVKDAVIDHKGELFILDNKDERYRMIRLVDWKGFYIP